MRFFSRELLLAASKSTQLYAAGYQVFTGLGNNVTAFTPLLNITDVKSIHSAGLHCTMALKNDGTLWGCGTKYFLGIGASESQVGSFVQVADNVKRVFVGSGTWIVKNDGTMQACGVNTYGQLGIGTKANTGVWTDVPGVTDAVSIGSIYSNTVTTLVDASGRAYISGGLANEYLFTQIGTNTNWKEAISANYILNANGERYTVTTTPSISESGTYINARKVLGYPFSSTNGYWLSEDGVFYYRNGSIDTVLAEDVKDISGSNGLLILKNDGTLWAMGDNDYGQLGIGSTVDQAVLTQVPIDKKVVALGAGGQSSYIWVEE